uniref:RGS domain-containing protein n=1 Tax=Strongyloides papillosus TaxID=174720 RepID=A0A0N5CDT3_STREA
MASNDESKSEATPSTNSSFSEILKLNEDALANLFKKQLTTPTMQFYGGTPFTEYIDKNAVFFSQLETYEENEKTAHLLSCLSDDVYRLLKLSRPNTALAKCKYSELVDDLTNFYTETVKYAQEYSKLLLVKGYYNNVKELHRMKQAEWKNLEECTSQKIPDLVKILLLFEYYKEPVKAVAEKYIQENHANIVLGNFITHMESESLFLQDAPGSGAAVRKFRNKK